MGHFIFGSNSSTDFTPLEKSALAAVPDLSSGPLLFHSVEVAEVAPRWLLTRVHTENGITGYGEGTYEGQSEKIPGYIQGMVEECQELKMDLRNPQAFLEYLRTKTFYNRDGAFWSASAALEIAMWDIIGKELNRPIHALLGGAVCDRVQIYRWAGGNFELGEPKEPAVEQVKGLVEQGLRAIKLNASPGMGAVDTHGAIRQAIERAEAIRDAVGPRIELAFDFHGRVSPANAGVLAKGLERVNPFFLEEVFTPEHNDRYPGFRSQTNSRMATGERMFEPETFARLVANGGVDIVQPDLIHVGGINRTREIANAAALLGAAIAPHCPMSPVGFLACVHVVAASRNGFIQECSSGIHYNDSGAKGRDLFLFYLTPESQKVVTMDARDGCLALPMRPGLGIELDWEKVVEASRDYVRWKENRFIGPDGRSQRW